MQQMTQIQFLQALQGISSVVEFQLDIHVNRLLQDSSHEL